MHLRNLWIFLKVNIQIFYMLCKHWSGTFVLFWCGFILSLAVGNSGNDKSNKVGFTDAYLHKLHFMYLNRKKKNNCASQVTMAASQKSKVFPVPFCFRLLMPLISIILIGDSIKCEEEPYVDIDKYWGTVTIPAGKSGELLSHVKHLDCNIWEKNYIP